MAALHDRQWIIEVNGQEAGPFTLDELRSLLKEKQILPKFRVRSRLDAAAGWTSIEALLQRQSEFVPPKRPVHSGEFVTRITTPVNQALSNDPTENLFEALQIAKEKQSPGGTKTTIIRPSTHTRFKWGAPLIATAGVATIAVGLTLWSAHQVFSISAGRSISSQDSVAEKSEPARSAQKEVANHDSTTPHFTIGNPPSNPPTRGGARAEANAPHEPIRRSLGGDSGPTVFERSKPAKLGQPSGSSVSQSESMVEEISPQEAQDAELASGQKIQEEKRLNPSAKVVSDSIDESSDEEGGEESADTRMVNDFQN